MAKAKPVGAVRSDAPAAPGMAPAAPAGTPTAAHFDGLPMVGTFFFQGTPVSGDSTYCSGSVVRSKGKNMVLTAGHCGTQLRNSVQRIFVPQYRYGLGSSDQPWGVFPVHEVYMDGRYENNGRGPTSDLDFAFVTVNANAKGAVENLTGALTFTPATTYEHNVTVVGYPSKGKDNPSHKAIRCDVPTTRLHGFRQMKMECGGFHPGVSGGPWIKGYNPKTNTGQVIGNVGGVGGGGDVHWISYSPLYGKDAQDLYNDANNGIGEKNVHRPNPYQGATDGPVLPGSGETWKHAKRIASGDFSGTGHSDLLVIWTDGEVTLYPGDGNGGFRPERQLLAPNAGWKPAATITAGDFTGSNQFDLMVRWDDGRMTLHGDVGSNGLNGGTEMAPSGSIWSHATQIAAGRFNAATYVTDLMVRWSDGELSLFTNVGAGTMGQEYKLKDPNSTWKDATLLTSGQFSGNQKWDLMVRWSSGALNNYVGTTTGGLGSEQPIHGPNKTWTHSVIMTTGQYTGDGLTNDLIIRWSDGETTMYKDTRMNNLGTEIMIAPPA
ncbi:trypsin-like serine peptidase [Streptomyces virginiae]|uniref:trypsin-like serine peptidase n=1 Tax=Streptomyces virginiae TaxID=1961 RepID=UPI00224DA724|nr:FG-GAP-like repeat-containing protein [Streptomyces virginiae]MCX5275065.1 FG-GAP-like repeat-containing protein [Streptomyces virginiae]